MIQRIKGTQDWLDLTLLNFVLEQTKGHLSTYNFFEIKTPILEPTELFKRSLGIATDVVSKEMFIIKTVNNDDSICLRPEATASTMRAFLEESKQGIELPWNVFSWGPMFRYERPQKGRFREFHQINLETIGSRSVSNDALFITMLDRLFHEHFSLQNYALTINFLGSFDDRAAYKKILEDFLNNLSGMCTTCEVRKTANTLRVFDCKDQSCQELYKDAPKMIDHLSPDSQKEWDELQTQLELLSVSYVINPRLVRGLDYYNKTVFEFVSNDLGAQNAFCAGGRYDGLAQELGSKNPIPSIGGAIGIERLLILLDTNEGNLAIPSKPQLNVIIPMEEEQKTLALLLADELHAQGICTQALLDGQPLKKMMKKANKMGATYAIIIGQEEQQKHAVTLKNMVTGAQQTIKQIELAQMLSS